MQGKPGTGKPASRDMTHQEMLRYNRQIVLRNFDFDAQLRLKAARVLIVGLGGLGCAGAQYLAAAGVGNLSLLDFDTVSLSNLQRQILHRDASIGHPKVESARDTLAAINPHSHLTAINQQLDNDALGTLIARHDLVLDCTDNLASRNQLNLLCYQLKKPLISGAVIRMEGQISVFTYAPGEPCYRCLSQLFADNTLSCAETGVMAPLPGIIGALQAIEAIKLLTAYGTPCRGKILLYDAMICQFQQITLAVNPHCEVCGHTP